MRLVEVLMQNGLEREEIEIDVPTAADRDVTITLRSVTRGKSPAESGGFGSLGTTDEKTQKIPRATWDNLVAALATQRARKS